MINKLLMVAFVLGVCWLAACDDSSQPPDRADAPERGGASERSGAPAESDSGGRRSATEEDDPFAWAEDTPDLTDEDLAAAEQPAESAETVDVATTADYAGALANQPDVEPDEPEEDQASEDQPSTPVREDPFAWADEAPDLTDEELAAAETPSEPADETSDEAAAPAEETPAAEDNAPATSVLGFTMTRIDGSVQPLNAYQGKVMLIVNTASQCGYTPQYAGLQALHEQFADDGLAVLGFPANNFQNQEPGSDADIASFCRTNYGVTFDMFSKISVAGADRHALYNLLTAADAAPAGAGPVQWNFEKFLIARDGTVVGHFRSDVTPGDPVLQAGIQRELAK